MQRCFTSQSHFRPINEENAWVAEWRPADIPNLGPRQEAKFHQTPGVSFRQFNRVDNTLLAQPQLS